MPRLTFPSPVGTLTIASDGDAITDINWKSTGPPDTQVPELLAARDQILAYLDGQLEEFDLPLAVRGSDFQRAVCDAMSAIPFGETLTYGQIAKQVGASAQAVGAACGGNPIPIVIPCHRVLGATSLGGFSGGAGIDTKVWLLKHERAAGLLI